MPRIASQIISNWEENILIEASEENILHLYEISKKCAKQSDLFNTIIVSKSKRIPYEDDHITIPIRHIKLSIVDLVIQYMEYHASTQPLVIDKPLSSKLENIFDSWDYSFFQNNFSPIGQKDGMKILLEVLSAAHDLSIPSLVDFSCAAIASIMKNKSPDELRELFNLVNDFTDDEIKRHREESKIIE